MTGTGVSSRSLSPSRPSYRPDAMMSTTARAVADLHRRAPSAGPSQSPVVRTDASSSGTRRRMGPTHLAWRRRVSSGAAFTATPGRCSRDTTTNSQVVVAAARRGDYGTAVGHQDTSLAQTPNEGAPILAGVAFFGTFFAAMAMRKRRGRDARDDGTDQRRRGTRRGRPAAAEDRGGAHDGRARRDAIRPRRARVVSKPKLQVERRLAVRPGHRVRQDPRPGPGR